MLVYEFMVPAEKVIKVSPSDTIENALDKLLENHISAIVVVSDDPENNNNVVGLVTKTDIAKAYKQGLPLTETCETIMTTSIKSISKSLQRDQAAKVFACYKIHHAIVVDDEKQFVGLISAWDCAKEGYLDHGARPWDRRMMGRPI